ncbi:hypothetical protein [Clostridium celatum]|uniref:hypothetical protein n=1 Tax=Clostridium celatum TaxID=36834 RepID=UPI00189BDD1E|nr:hypothetical protein [Clostridium celatum]
MSKNKKLIVFLVIILLITIAYIALNKIMNNHLYQLNKIIELNIPKDSTILKWNDEHDGFHGDGETYAEIKLTKEGMEKFIIDAQETNKWNSIPLSKELKTIVYGGDYGGISYDIGKMSKNIPDDIKRGIYYFRDRYAEHYTEHIDTNINSRYSYNLTISILDFDANKLYIYELDT